MRRGGPSRGTPSGWQVMTGSYFRSGLPLRCTDLGTERVFVPGLLPADHLDVRGGLVVWPRAGVLNPLTESLVVGARTIFGQRARLAVHLNRASALIFERRDHVALIMALQHAHAPHPVEEHGLEVFGVRCGCVGFSNPTVLTLRTGRPRHADREDDHKRDTCPINPATKIHGGLLPLTMPMLLPFSLI